MMDFMSRHSQPDYIGRISELLRPRVGTAGVVLDLFAGCGGLGLGFEAAGFETVGYEMDADCCATYNLNLSGTCHQSFLTTETRFPAAEIVVGGPPCQPFSVGGHQRGLEDSRDGFPAFIAAVEQVRPSLFLLENVRGLLYRNRWYLSEVVSRLEQIGYIVDFKLLNAVDFRVPQKRERLIVVGHKGGYAFPTPSHSRVTAGQALGESAFAAPGDGKYLTESMDEYVGRYERASQCVNPRDLDLEKPSRTLTCRNIAAPTGDMHRIKLPDGRRRRLSVREAARLQSFPDWFEFNGNETSQFYQIGNAVPPMLSHALAQSAATYLRTFSPLDEDEIQMRRQPVQAELMLGQ